MHFPKYIFLTNYILFPNTYFSQIIYFSQMYLFLNVYFPKHTFSHVGNVLNVYFLCKYTNLKKKDFISQFFFSCRNKS